VNLNPLPPPPEAAEALRGCLSEDVARRYPDYEYSELREALRSFYGVDEVVPLNGSSEGVLLAALAVRARTLVAVQPSYGEHRDLAEALGLRYEPLAMEMRGDEFALDLGELEARCGDPGALIALTNPNNPTGSFVDPRALEDLAAGCRSWVLLDEAYAELSDAYPGLRPPVGDRLIVLRSLTKWLSVPGLRLGFAVAPREIAARMDALRAPWNVGSIAECFARRSLGSAAGAMYIHIIKSREYLSVERARLADRVRGIGLLPFRSSANFLLLMHRRSARPLVERLRARGINVREGWTFEGLDDRFLRVAVRSREDDDLLLGSLEEAAIERRGPHKGTGGAPGSPDRNTVQGLDGGGRALVRRGPRDRVRQGAPDIDPTAGHRAPPAVRRGGPGPGDALPGAGLHAR
jgi:threonine-phosphate decarboxylase